MSASTASAPTVAQMNRRPDLQRRVLRARIGVRWPDTVERAHLEQAICAAIADAVTSLGGELDLLQLDLAANPSWAGTGPTDRVTGQPIDPDR